MAALDLVAQAALTRRLNLFEVLETARRALCCYSADPCDCKYGITVDTRPGTEATGCCELRDLIKDWTGFGAFHRHGVSVQDEVARLREWVNDGEPVPQVACRICNTEDDWNTSGWEFTSDSGWRCPDHVEVR